jgi:hypothetical protein
MKKLNLETINKNLVIIAILLLLFRNGSFGVTGIPQPFEIAFIVVSLIALIDFVVNKKFTRFLNVFPENIKVASLLIFASIFFGWIISILIVKIPTTLNTFFEFGSFVVGFSFASLVFYYASLDKSYIKKCLYALSLPVIYSICILFPEFGNNIDLIRNGTFKGFTGNVNIVSKALIVPLMLLLSFSFLSYKNLAKKSLYGLIASFVLGLLFWTTERATVISYVVGGGLIFIAVYKNIHSWKNSLANIIVVILITGLAFSFIPNIGKKVVLGRILHFDGHSQDYEKVKDKNLKEVAENVFVERQPVTLSLLTDPKNSPEPRFQLWDYYINFVLRNPLGVGPNTHMPVVIKYAKSVFINPGPHNTFLQIFMWGGIVGFVSFVYIIYVAIKNVYVAFKETLSVSALALYGSLIGFLVAIFFNDGLQSYWFWVILSLCLVYENTKS